MIQIIPVVIIAPAFMRGDMEFGVITQSAAAFAMLVGAFSFIVRQFKSISNFAAVVARISSLLEAVEDAREPAKTKLEIIEANRNLAYDHLTLKSSIGETLLRELSATIPADARVVVQGDDDAVAAALFRATAGIGAFGEGRIERPPRDQLRIIAQRTCLAPGSLRQILVPSGQVQTVSNEEIIMLLKELGFAHALNADDFEEEQDWSSLLSPREQHILAIVGVLIAAPNYVLLENADAIFGHDLVGEILRLLAERKITCVNFAEANAFRTAYDAIIDCHADGSWSWIDQRTRPDGQPVL